MKEVVRKINFTLGLFPQSSLMQNRFWKSPWLAATIVFLVLLVIYSITLAPTFLHIDCGELAATQYSLGISHPTGYPLFSILCYLFLKIPLFSRPIIQSNFLAALWTAGGVALYATWLCKILRTNFSKPDSKKKAVEQEPSGIAESLSISIFAALTLGLTLTVWAQATSIEVYSLHVFLLGCLLVSAFNALQRDTSLSWTICAVILALGFSNHMTTLMILPMLAWLYFDKRGFQKSSFTSLIVPALAGLGVMILLYGFLFIRSGQDPLLCWGDIHDWTTFKRHLTGHQYRSWIMAGSKVAAKNLGKFLKAFPHEWAMVGPILMIMGVSVALKWARTWFWAIIAGMSFNIFYVIQYDIKDLEPYFLLAMMGFTFLLAFGMKRIIHQFRKPWTVIAIGFVPLLALGLNFKASNQKDTRFFEEYTNAALGSIEPNALVMSQQWDFLITQYYYLRVVEGKFPGVFVIDKELLRRSWYVNKQATLFDKEIFKGVETEKEAFLLALKPFEEEKPFDPNQIEEAYQSFLGKILTEQLKKRPVYIGMECIANQGVRVPPGYKVIPAGFWLKLVAQNAGYIPNTPPVFNPYFPDNWKGKSVNAYYSGFIRDTWNRSVTNRIEYETGFGKIEEANHWQKLYLQNE